MSSALPYVPLVPFSSDPGPFGGDSTTENLSLHYDVSIYRMMKSVFLVARSSAHDQFFLLFFSGIRMKICLQNNREADQNFRL